MGRAFYVLYPSLSKRIATERFVSLRLYAIAPQKNEVLQLRHDCCLNCSAPSQGPSCQFLIARIMPSSDE